MISSTAPGKRSVSSRRPPHRAKIVASKKDVDQETDLIFTQDTHDEPTAKPRKAGNYPFHTA